MESAQEEAAKCPKHIDADWVHMPYAQQVHDLTTALFHLIDVPHPEEDCVDLITARESLVLVSQRLMDRQMRQDPFIAWLDGEIEGSEAQIARWTEQSPWSKAIIISEADLQEPK